TPPFVRSWPGPRWATREPPTNCSKMAWVEAGSRAGPEPAVATPDPSGVDEQPARAGSSTSAPGRFMVDDSSGGDDRGPDQAVGRAEELAGVFGQGGVVPAVGLEAHGGHGR